VKQVFEGKMINGCKQYSLAKNYPSSKRKQLWLILIKNRNIMLPNKLWLDHFFYGFLTILCSKKIEKCLRKLKKTSIPLFVCSFCHQELRTSSVLELHRGGSHRLSLNPHSRWNSISSDC